MASATYRAAKLAGLVAAVLGLVVGGLIFYIAGVENPQEEFHGADHSSLLAWVLLGAVWFAAAFIVAFIGVFAVARAVFGWKRRTDGPRNDDARSELSHQKDRP